MYLPPCSPRCFSPPAGDPEELKALEEGDKAAAAAPEAAAAVAGFEASEVAYDAGAIPIEGGFDGGAAASGWDAAGAVEGSWGEAAVAVPADAAAGHWAPAATY